MRRRSSEGVRRRAACPVPGHRLLARGERARVQADSSMTEARRDIELKRLDGIAKILAQTAAREPSLFALLDENAEIGDLARWLHREMQLAAG